MLKEGRIQDSMSEHKDYHLITKIPRASKVFSLSLILPSLWMLALLSPSTSTILYREKVMAPEIFVSVYEYVCNHKEKGTS